MALRKGYQALLQEALAEAGRFGTNQTGRKMADFCGFDWRTRQGVTARKLGFEAMRRVMTAAYVSRGLNFSDRQPSCPEKDR